MVNGPQAMRRVIASEIKRMREHKGVKQRIVCQAIGLEPTALSRYEQARSSMTTMVAKRLFEYYEADNDQREWLLDLVARSRRRGWTADVQGQVLPRIEDLIALERDASSIQELEVQLVPGLLQTQAYASTILKSSFPGPQRSQHVAARMSRAQILNNEAPTEYTLIMRKTALQYVVGDSSTMNQQLKHLTQMATKNNISIRIYPDNTGEHVILTPSFRIMDFSVASHYRTVYLDYLTGSLYIDDPEEVALYSKAYQRLVDAAFNQEESLEIIESTRERLYA